MKKRKIVLSIMITVCTMFCLCGCSQKEPSVVRTYEKTDSKEAFENTEPVIMVMRTWKWIFSPARSLIWRFWIMYRT